MTAGNFALGIDIGGTFTDLVLDSPNSRHALKVLTTPDDPSRAVVEGVNRVKKHTKPNPMKGLTGGIVEKEMSIHLSNIAIFNPATSKADRVGFKTLDDKRKVRVFRSNGEVVDA